MISYILTALGTIVISLLSYFLQQLIKENKDLRGKEKQELIEKERNISHGIMCMLRVELKAYHAKYTKAGEIPAHIYQDFIEMYQVYHALGGNGTVTKMKNEIDELDIID